MLLTEINIYPVKSLAGISLQEAIVKKAGLQYDRRWMLLDQKGVFLTQREKPEMARIKLHWKKEGFEVTYDGQDSAYFPFTLPDAPAKKVRIWDDEVMARPVAGHIGEWFSEVLKTKCELVRLEENAVRHNLEGKPDKVSSFADGTPFLIIGEASLRDLNSRLETPVPMFRFRPNLVFSGDQPFLEDTWEHFRIGDIHFRKYKKCGRCIVTTIDQKKGMKTGKEPLLTLRRYRRENGQVNFGILAFLREDQGESIIRLGETVHE